MDKHILSFKDLFEPGRAAERRPQLPAMTGRRKKSFLKDRGESAVHAATDKRICQTQHY